jgi:predicted SAM-dependent methyltransferase
MVCGALWIEGWMIDPTGSDSVIELRVDDRPIATSVQKKPRPDVSAAYLDTIGDGEATGFCAAVESSQFSDNEHRLTCVVRRGGDTETVIATRSFQVRSGPRSDVACRFLQGSGLEIGALHSPQAVPAGCRVTYVDRFDVDGLRRQYQELAGHQLREVHVVDDGERLEKFAAASQDFIIANHFLEHTQDPIGTIKRHLEVLKPGGILFMAVPDKRKTFDIDRPVTPLEHLYRDHEEGPAWSYMDHMREYVTLVDHLTGEAVEAHVKLLVDVQYSIHFHVWTQNELLEMLVDIRRRLALPFDIETVVPHGNESIVVLRKRTEPS